MSKTFGALGLAFGALALACGPALAQATKVTNEGISANEIVIGTHQDLSGPIKVWGVPVSNGMKMAVEEINAAGGINGRKLRMILEDNGYDPKKAVLASQKMVERDKIFAMIGPMGSPTVLAAQDILFDAGVLQLFPLTAAEFTFKFDPAKPQERLKFNNLLPYVESTRAALKYMMDWKHFQKPCIMHQDDEYGKNVLDGFNQQLEAMKVPAASITSYKRGASDFSAQVAKMKSDGCDLVVLGTIIRETIGAMNEAKKLGWDVTFLVRRRPMCWKCRRWARMRSRASMQRQASRFPMRTRPRARSRSGSPTTRRCSAPMPIRKPSSATTQSRPLPSMCRRPART